MTLISIHALREEGDGMGRRAAKNLYISIHALREEGDLTATKTATYLKYFYPRPPRGGRPLPAARCGAHWPISIHALREEGD